MTPRTDTDLPNDLSLGRLGRDKQSNTSISPISPRSSNGDLESTGNYLYSGGEDASRLNLLNTDDGTLSRRESMEGASATDVGRTDDDASRGCHTSPDLELF